MSLNIKARHFIPAIPATSSGSIAEEEVMLIEFLVSGERGPSFLYIKPEGDFLIDTIDKFQYAGADRRVKTN